MHPARQRFQVRLIPRMPVDLEIQPNMLSDQHVSADPAPVKVLNEQRAFPRYTKR